MSDDAAFLAEMQAGPPPVAVMPPRTNILPTPLSLSTGNILVSRNTTTVVHHHAKKQRLRPEQMTQVDTFMTDSQTIRETKLYIGILGIQNDLQKIIAAKPAYSGTNIQVYVAPVLLSPKLATYKGTEPVQLVFNIIKKYRFDTPAGFENIPADAAKITTTIEEAFTQGRSKFKKILFSSVKIMRDKKPVDLPADKHQSLFALAQAFVKGTKCRINPGLCGRIALMRKTFLKFPGSDFWDKLDLRLAAIRDDCENAEDIDMTFEALIEADKELHGNVDIVYEGTDDIQDKIDTTIATASVIDAAITVPASASGSLTAAATDAEESAAGTEG
ncbi:hypothetical protein B0H16DRAFT_1809836 [Mycena metata]|uniref:Uncharacterized protein n=1 Tax=Mycena metata TaxID=1033252 RepID=A0AAD7JEE1_9AGAR|nr:hypothetical protein B0H16DRAFT_1809836 [Mycena metata]